MKIQWLFSMLPLCLSCLCFGCSRPKDFNSFLAYEISVYGGRANSFATTNVLSGYWTFKTDHWGAKIDTKGISFQGITNDLTPIYGPPRFYSPAAYGLGPTYFYKETNAGACVCITVCANGLDAQVCLLKTQ
jgi:hypothetical protein